MPGVPLSALVLSGLLIADSIRADRDDMSIFMLWIVREYIHAGPRIVREGWRSAVRARYLSQLDIETCAEVLAYLATKQPPRPGRN